MRKMMQRSLSCLLTLAMVVTMLMTSTLAAEKSAKLEFDYSANYESSKIVSLEVYKGYPANGYAAAMIDAAGLKGERVGGAMVSTKHAGFVINAGGASYEDVVALMREIRRRVYEREGVLLEPEVKLMGPGL